MFLQQYGAMCWKMALEATYGTRHHLRVLDEAVPYTATLPISYSGTLYVSGSRAYFLLNSKH